MKTSIPMALAIFCAAAGNAQQKDTIHLRNTQNSFTQIVTDKPPQAVYFAIGGSAPIISAQYDQRFGKRLNGAGFTVGLGFFGLSGISVFSIPVSLNYLFGQRSNYFEVAAGATFVSATSTLFNRRSETGTALIQHVTIGHRYQPATGGFFFRGGFGPLLYDGEYITTYYLGFGHSF